MAEMLPFISVVMPVRNEARFIAETLTQLLGQDYPANRFEILVVDGFSDDGTRETVSRIASRHPQVRLLDNPGRLSSAGRNVGFRTGQGDIFLVVDGHCHIPTDRLLRNVAACFAHSGALCLGRPQPLDPPGLTPFQRTVALARASWLGHGGDSLIYSDYEGPASPVSNGAAYRREIFARVGYVDEAFDACEDVEFNYRVEEAGCPTFTSPRLTVRYYPRESLAGLVRQMIRYGRGRVRLYRAHPEAFGLHAAVPAVLTGGVAAAAALWAARFLAGPLHPLLAGLLWLCTGGAALYGLVVAAESARIGLARAKEEGICAAARHALRLPGIFAAVHFGLGLGMWRELLGPGGKPARVENAAGPDGGPDPRPEAGVACHGQSGRSGQAGESGAGRGGVRA
ncbi:glycosyltransferase-like protein [Desulfovibrio sp. X2]|uniref:glycosyltransferase family 2 protein n=1 Tax=Desulfovibrio sp. X2 TaxID=941449 RepID=UPI000358B12A|nr:glycosyltransferase family 2 protein [Desulfovibrio sp. X2]EPR37239.1 glycosyltransferase-like protein [Desulfovibrio sp. X2]